MPKLYKKLIDIIALLCLAAVFLFTFSYLKSWWTEEIGEKRQEQNVWKEKRTGTWCTIKSNSLDGVPIYDEAGGSVPIGSLPEGKLCELTDSTIKEGKKWGKVKYAGLSGWINLYYAGCYPESSKAAWKVETLSSAQQINFREKPGEDQRSIAKVPENTYLEMKEFKNGWGRTEYEGQEGWVKLSYLTPCKKKK